jgi:hypothetical protein
LHVEDDILALVLMEPATDVNVVFTFIARGDDDDFSRTRQLGVQEFLGVGAVMGAVVVAETQVDDARAVACLREDP